MVKRRDVRHGEGAPTRQRIHALEDSDSLCQDPPNHFAPLDLGVGFHLAM
jgi:hypothetical protein